MMCALTQAANKMTHRVGQLPITPAKVEHCVDPAKHMIGRHNLVEVERIEELALVSFTPPHHRWPPPQASGLTVRLVLNGVLQHVPGYGRRRSSPPVEVPSILTSERISARIIRPWNFSGARVARPLRAPSHSGRGSAQSERI
jgi:hypothetical protein